jgi:hypothetical protein
MGRRQIGVSAMKYGRKIKRRTGIGLPEKPKLTRTRLSLTSARYARKFRRQAKIQPPEKPTQRRWLFAAAAAVILALTVLVFLSRLWLARVIRFAIGRAVIEPWNSDSRQMVLRTLVAAALLAAMFAIWKVPQWQVELSPKLSSKNRFDRENEARKTLAQILGGIFVLAGLYASLQTARMQTETFNLQRDGQITDRYTKAIEQLGAVLPGAKDEKSGGLLLNLPVRLGGIYALERIALDSPKDRATIMEVLSAYIRDNAHVPIVTIDGISSTTCVDHQSILNRPPAPRPDIQAILTVIGRRRMGDGFPEEMIDLSETELGSARLSDAHLEKANLTQACLDSADLEGAHLEGAYLNGASLASASLTGADLRGADLDGTNLSEAWLKGANLSGALNSRQSQFFMTQGDTKTKLPNGIKSPGW